MKELKLSWRKGPKAPTTMSRGSSTIIGTPSMSILTVAEFSMPSTVTLQSGQPYQSILTHTFHLQVSTASSQQ